MTALKTLPAQSDKFRSLMSNLSSGEFTFVDVQSVGVDQAALNASVKKNASQISELRMLLSHATLTGDDGVITTLPKVLKAKNVMVDQVVAISVTGNQITVYYQ